jgi:hypothetical protein
MLCWSEQDPALAHGRAHGHCTQRDDNDIFAALRALLYLASIALKCLCAQLMPLWCELFDAPATWLRHMLALAGEVAELSILSAASKGNFVQYNVDGHHVYRSKLFMQILCEAQRGQGYTSQIATPRGTAGGPASPGRSSSRPLWRLDARTCVDCGQEAAGGYLAAVVVAPRPGS